MVYMWLCADVHVPTHLLCLCGFVYNRVELQFYSADEECVIRLKAMEEVELELKLALLISLQKFHVFSVLIDTM